ncbi:hypothetical protein CYMTET_14777 [Cymbomonas tetramitiformis]|uniref:Uncharacterized protein n=1 Tax=Cymbomonas tetramitiformis TaxID=36881 RepID=A0AAE0L9P5_9CHLO|nr:hypothetical protein CYMTET_14777 [Cymbomonas tetramitiformis]
MEGHEDAANALMEERADVNVGTGRRPLHVAADKGMIDMVKQLIRKGAEKDAADKEGCTALTRAWGHEDAAHALMEAGADVNVGTGRRPLHVAAEKGMIQMVKQLIRKGAEKDAEDKEGCTALTWAVRGRHEDVANALMEAGADVNVGTGRRSLHDAAEKGMIEMVK